MPLYSSYLPANISGNLFHAVANIPTENNVAYHSKMGNLALCFLAGGR